ncbi:hypothetical protein QFZ41_002588 [Luteibacter sp. W1I16]|uniref:hypothetical protein n=1 Tax=Luteibacter sp. W1I16 TaxID=3373922 RepID=UPI003D23B18E
MAEKPSRFFLVMPVVHRIPVLLAIPDSISEKRFYQLAVGDMTKETDTIDLRLVLDFHVAVTMEVPTSVEAALS